MDKIRISKVEDVTLWKQGKRVEGTLHLLPHHIIFEYLETLSGPSRRREMWITYPMIAFCTYRPAPPASHQAPSIRLRCRDFNYLAFHFVSETKAFEVYTTVKSLTCYLGRVEKLYAFEYRPREPESKFNGWEIYDARRELKRMGISAKDTDKGWRISEINKDYEYCPTYPALIVVPKIVSDLVLKHGGPFRSRSRIPALTYLHPLNNCSITRSSQPLSGLRNNRSVQDEKLLSAIFATSKPDVRTLGLFEPPQVPSQMSPNQSTLLLNSGESSFVEASAEESGPVDDVTNDPSPRKLYGATQVNLIVDARPTINALATKAQGKGSENMDYYKFATKHYLGIENIHVMRRSLNTVIEALKDTDMTPLPPDREKLAKSGWLTHIATLLEGTCLIAKQVGIYHSHVLIHCSDGWDRTGQLSALSQLCLDPYYRTMEGFAVLVEKDFLSFGYMFRQRCGFLGSEKWFEIENERVGGRNASNGNTFGSMGAGGAVLENAFNSARGLFNRKNASRESLGFESDGELQSIGHPSSSLTPSAPSGSGPAEKRMKTSVDEVSPIFQQFLDGTYQLLYQHPTRFEFNERFLRRLLYHLYSCQYGTFLYDSERERVQTRAKDQTRSVWDYFFSRRDQFLNLDYDPTIDDNIRGKETLLFPDPKKVRWWAEVFGRTDKDMNHPFPAGSANVQSGLVAKVASLGIGMGSPTPSRPRSPQSQQASMETDSSIATPKDENTSGSECIISGDGTITTSLAGMSELSETSPLDDESSTDGATEEAEWIQAEPQLQDPTRSPIVHVSASEPPTRPVSSIGRDCLSTPFDPDDPLGARHLDD